MYVYIGVFEVYFWLSGALPPLEVLQIGPGRGVIVGGERSSYNNTPVKLPASVDTVNRLVYYVSDGNIVSRVSLDNNAEPQVSDVCFFLTEDHLLGLVFLVHI